MSDDIAAQLASANRAYLIAPAGCGKTEVIAKAVRLAPKGRHLVLTHTHAGVACLISRFRKHGVTPGSYRIDTVAGWALQYAASYRKLSRLQNPRPDDSEWDDVYKAALVALRYKAIQEVVRASYTGLYVDEYQDCTSLQHEIILALAEILPCRILGDPLQAIFDFGGSPLVNWEQQIIPNFSRLPDLTDPWRWKNAGREDLGRWLLSIREPLRNSQPIPLSGAPAAWSKLDHSTQRTHCFNLARDANASIVAIHKWPNGAHEFTRKLGGPFSSSEEIFCKDLLSFCEKIEQATGAARIQLLVEFAGKYSTSTSTALKPVIEKLKSDGIDGLSKIRKLPAVVSALKTVGTNPELHHILSAMDAITTIPKARVFRHELLSDTRRAITQYTNGQYATLRESAWEVRSRGRFMGRNPRRRTVSRTLLIKGLEFDHAIILNADDLSPRELYVALTRGAKSVTVLSESQVLNPSRQTEQRRPARGNQAGTARNRPVRLPVPSPPPQPQPI